MIGDYALLSYAVFVKAEQENKVALKIYTHDHVLEVKPGQLKPIIILDGEVITNYEKGTVIPIDENIRFRFVPLILKMSFYHSYFKIHLKEF